MSNEELDRLTFPLYPVAVKILTGIFLDKLKVLEAIEKLEELNEN